MSDKLNDLDRPGGSVPSVKTEQHEKGDPDADDTITSNPNVILPSRKWIMEPLCLIFCIGVLVQSPVVTQFVYYRIGQQYNATQNSSRAFVCDVNSLANSSEHSLTDQIQSEASSWTMYRDTVSSIVALLVLPFYTSSSDYLGRKPALLLPCLGMALDGIGVLLVVLLELPLLGLVVSSALGALGGGFGTLFAGMFSYLADTTSRKMRPIRMVIVEAMFGVAAAVLGSVMGWWIKLMGYTVPLIVSTAILVLNVLYVIFFVPEVRRRASDAKTVALSRVRLVLLPFTNIFSLFSTSVHISAILALLLSALLLFCFGFMGANTVSSLYQMNYPFCLDSVFIGYLSTAKVVGYQVGATIGLLGLRKFLGVKTIGLIILGLLSSSLGSLVTGFAFNTAMLFVAAAVSMFAMLTIPMLRAYTSQITPADRQGALFSCIGIFEVVGNLVGTTGFTLLYKSTLSWMPGFVYVVCSGTTALALVLTALSFLTTTCCPPRRPDTEADENSGKYAPQEADDASGCDDDKKGIVN